MHYTIGISWDYSFLKSTIFWSVKLKQHYFRFIKLCESNGYFKNNFSGFKDHKLTSVQVSPLKHFEKSKILKDKLVVFADRMRGYFFTSVLGAKLWASVPHPQYHPRYLRFSHSPMMHFSEKIYGCLSGSRWYLVQI